MEVLPREIKFSILKRSAHDHEKDRGVSLEVPRRLLNLIREEIINVILDPNFDSYLKVFVEEFGYVVLNLTLLPEQRKIIIPEEQSPDRNYLPLLWHKDGGVKHLAPFSILFTDVEGPIRRSNTVVSEVSHVFPSLIKSCHEMIIHLQKDSSSREVLAAWRKSKKKLETVLSSTSSPAPARQIEIRYAIEHLINTFDFSFFNRAMDYDDYTQIITDSIKSAGNYAYIHQWKAQQLLMVSSRDEFIHCRNPVRRGKQSGGKLYAKAVRRK